MISALDLYKKYKGKIEERQKYKKENKQYLFDLELFEMELDDIKRYIENTPDGVYNKYRSTILTNLGYDIDVHRSFCESR